MQPDPDVWLRGPVPGVPLEIMPVVHSLLQIREELEPVVVGLSREQLWTRPGGAASIGFHLKHLAGSLDRLLTYAHGQALSHRQQHALEQESRSDADAETAATLLARVRAAIDRSIEQVRTTPVDTLDEWREVGRARLPSTVRGLLFHAAEHGQRHSAQIITTAKIIRADRLE
jgi:uncharacterized damage-inducible protein DinB